MKTVKFERNADIGAIVLTNPPMNRLGCQFADDQVSMAMAESLVGPSLAFGAMGALLNAWSPGGVPATDELLLDLTMKLFDTEDAQHAYRSLKAAVEAGGNEAQTEASTKLTFQDGKYMFPRR
jgi:hypothetical protein